MNKEYIRISSRVYEKPILHFVKMQERNILLDDSGDNPEFEIDPDKTGDWA